MTVTFKTLLNPLDGDKRRTLCDVSSISEAQETPFMVFGAFARDVHFYHARNIEIGRKTSDVDVSIQVKDWGAYNRFADALGSLGYGPESAEHPEKMTHRDTGQELDILPFGEIAENGTVIWPSDGSPWSVVGFDEAFDNADRLPVVGEDGLERMIAIAPIPALVVLKIVAICDRPQKRHKKDGTDIAFMLNHYLDDAARTRLLSDQFADVVSASKGDLDVAAAILMGCDMAQLLRTDNRDRIGEIIRHDIDSSSRCYLIRGLIGRYYDNFARAREIASKLLEGLARNA